MFIHTTFNPAILDVAKSPHTQPPLSLIGTASFLLDSHRTVCIAQ